MASNVAPNAAHHYWCMSVKGSSLAKEKYANSLVFIRGKDFESGNEISTETDEGHTGAANLDMGSYRSGANSSPAWEDKLRFCEGLEEMFYLLLGTVGDGTGTDPSPVSGETGVYKYAFSFPPTNAAELPFATIYNGFAKTEGDARIFNNAVINEFELSCSNEEAPTIKSTFVSDYNNMNCKNPTRSFASKTNFVKSKQVNVFYGEVTDNETAMRSKKLGCFLEASLKVNNNFDSKPCQEDEFGKNTKFMGVRESEGTIKLPWTDATKKLEPEYEALDKQGHVVSEETLFKQVWFEMTGIKIGTTTKNYSILIKIPKVEITKAESPLSGDEAKDLTLEYKIIEEPTQSFMNVDVVTSLDKLRIDTTGKDLADLIYTPSP